MIENPRFRLALAEHGRRIALALAVLGAALLVLAIWSLLSTPTEAVTQETDSQTITTSVDHEALVRSSDSPWESGTRLQNHPAYLLNASPVLEVQVQTEAPPGSTVVHDARLELRVVRDGGGVVWQDSEPLASGEARASEGTVSHEADIDVRDVRDRIAGLQEEFAGVGTVEVEIVADAHYETDQYDGSLTATAPLSVTDRAFWIEDDTTARDSPSRTVTVTREAPPDWGSILILVVLGLTSVVGAAAAATHRVETDIEWLRQELHRQRFDDWISDGSIPMGVGGEYVSLDSLKDVVDVAIDTNQRVVYDDRRDVFAVISGDVVYYYSKDGDWNRVAWPQAEPGDQGPSFLEAFGMGEEGEGTPEVEAASARDGGFESFSDTGGGGPFSNGPDDGEFPTSGGSTAGESTDVRGNDARGEDGRGSTGGAVDGSDDATGAQDGSADDQPPDDGSLSPAERPPADRPFGGDDDESE